MAAVSPNSCNKKPEIGKEFQGAEERRGINNYNLLLDKSSYGCGAVRCRYCTDFDFLDSEMS